MNGKNSFLTTNEDVAEPIENIEIDDSLSMRDLDLYPLVFVCFVCENEWYTSVPALDNIVMTCPSCWNPSGMREDITYRGLDTGH